MKIGDKVIKRTWGRYGGDYSIGIISRVGPKTVGLETERGFWLGDRVDPADLKLFSVEPWNKLFILEDKIKGLEAQIQDARQAQRELWGALPNA